jgi:hypothetical protein
MLLVRQAMYELKSDFDFTLKPELEKIDSADCFHLELKRKTSQLPPASAPKMEYADKIDLWVEVETFLTTRVRVTEKMPGKSEEITLSKTETERAIDPKLFEVPVFPPDVAVDEK